MFCLYFISQLVGVYADGWHRLGTNEQSKCVQQCMRDGHILHFYILGHFEC